VTALGGIARVSARIISGKVATATAIRSAPSVIKVIVKAAPKVAAKLVVATAVVLAINDKTGLELEAGDLIAIVGGPAGVGARIGFKIGKRLSER